MRPSEFRALVSGQRKGPAAIALRAALRLAETPYAVAVAWRNRGYDVGRRPIERVGVPVISVGNLTLGGSGKTPMVEWLARWLRARDVRVTIISRGYGAEAGARNDEALELEERLPDVPHLQNPDRVEAARVAIEEFEC
ncbi:MAG TPA: tetraacyldisaccharide 4'-kinase, partial [Pirellulales bacterium]|nr:tetraacyldisaccharide 4'-kinase [Pirellulales bacterium]